MGGLGVDAAGNVFADGTFTGPTSFGGETLTPAGGVASDVFVAKVDPNGQTVWARTFGGPDPDFGNTLGLDAAGNLYLGGSFSGTLDIPGAMLHSQQRGASMRSWPSSTSTAMACGPFVPGVQATMLSPPWRCEAPTMWR